MRHRPWFNAELHSIFMPITLDRRFEFIYQCINNGHKTYWYFTVPWHHKLLWTVAIFYVTFLICLVSLWLGCIVGFALMCYLTNQVFLDHKFVTGKTL